MMLIEILRIMLLLVTIVLAAQGLFYELGPAAAMKTLSLTTFAEQRVAIDKEISGKLKILYYGALCLGLAVLVLLSMQFNTLTFVCSACATLLTLADVLLARKFNLPINKAFKSYPDGPVPWRDLQLQWIKFIVIRGSLSIMAMLLQLTPWLLPH
jgi:hypothetical protein